MHNLPLKKDAFRNLDLPIEIKTGVVGKIRCEIPIRALRSEPWIISVEGTSELLISKYLWVYKDSQEGRRDNNGRNVR